MSRPWRSLAALASILTIAGAVIVAQESKTQSDTYTWNGELVSIDTTGKTLTVKSRVAYQETLRFSGLCILSIHRHEHKILTVVDNL